jgi:FAD dependent monooxygenase
MDKKSFRVIIVGGSIAGLTLAHCLDRAQIDYVILERRAEVAPQEGASLGIMPNGARILQQLGLYSKLEELIHPLKEAHLNYPDGFSYTSQYPRLLRERYVSSDCSSSAPRVLSCCFGPANLMYL